MNKPKYKLEKMRGGWVSIYILVGGTHYEWVKYVCDMDTAKRYTGG